MIILMGSRDGLRAEDATEVAAAYGLGRPTGPMAPVARGELGRIWRLSTQHGDVAVKDLFFPPTETDAQADVAFQLLAGEHGVLRPDPVRRPDGSSCSTGRTPARRLLLTSSPWSPPSTAWKQDDNSYGPTAMLGGQR